MSRSLKTLLLLALAAGPVLARAELKLGYVDLQRALNEVDEGKAAKALLKKDFSEREREATKGIFDRMAVIVREIAEADGVSMVFEKGAGLVYAPQSSDLTNELIRKYNARHQSGSAKKADKGEGKASKK